MKAPLLELKNIGKIYVSENNVAVGIRGVNASFERGEFVAVTGKSGSGKSTLLNVISGMDTYEEGELYVEGEPTSHFLQKDWEEYRKQYVSFIFQEYNIIESFTVLQNVELALMSIEDPKARRERALELLRRVGLEGHIHHKGSKLSGGQKQRTVIARALAKDSPILLCDEPTGNLDSKSSEEIIRLLREVSKDKLVIIVTHNFEQVEDYATRHIRIFDGAVESDHTLRPAERSEETVTRTASTVIHKTAHTLRSGLHLGRVRFTATPKLSVFLCILMALTMLTVTLITSLTYESRDLFYDRTMFSYMEGRTVIVRRDGGVMTDAEIEKLAADLGAVDHLHYDSMLDETVWEAVGDSYEYYEFSFSYPAERVKLSEGRYPERDNEIILEVPISAKPYLGTPFTETEMPLLFGMATYKVVGVRYYYDNTQTPRMLFTENGYRLATAMTYFSSQRYNFSYELTVSLPEGVTGVVDESAVHLSVDTLIDFDMEPGTYFINDMGFADTVLSMVSDADTPIRKEDLILKTTMAGDFVDYSYGGPYFDYWSKDVYIDDMEIMGGYGETVSITHPLDGYRPTFTMTESMKETLQEKFYDHWDEGYGIVSGVNAMILSPDIFMEFMYEQYYAKSYTQASLFFENDREARDKVETLREMGYIAVVSDETTDPTVMTLLEDKFAALFMGLLWVLAIVFSTLFLSLCSSRAMNATRGDIAIMRSMGIPTAVVKISIYVQTLISLIPAAILTALTCAAVFLIPKTNGMFFFLHAADYALIAAVLVLIALNLSRKYVKKMFNESVKKTLKGGAHK